jgi:hypothetical protein
MKSMAAIPPSNTASTSSVRTEAVANIANTIQRRILVGLLISAKAVKRNAKPTTSLRLSHPYRRGRK